MDKTKYEKIDVDGTVYKTLLTKKYNLRTEWEKANEKHLVAFIPGTIREIFVKEGQQVLEGDDLLILEAMKMRNVIVAPFAGVVKSINVSTNENVAKKCIMVELDYLPDEEQSI